MGLFVYSVSDAYKSAIRENARSFTWSGTIATIDGKEYAFTSEDVVNGSGYVTRQCSGSSEIELGSVYAAELGVSLFSDVDRYSLENAEIKLYFHLNLPDGTIETVPMGVFRVAEANRYVRTLELKAYDAMLNFEKAYDRAQSSGYPYDFLSAACEACGVELAQTREEIEALPNGTELFGVYPENDIETWRDFLHYLSQALGCFSQISRDGKLLLVGYTAQPAATISNTHRFSSSFSDFVTRYTAIRFTNRRTETAEYYALDPDDGLTMDLESNYLLQFGLDETRKRVFTNLLNAAAVINYVPFDSETIGDPALDPGDVLTFAGGQADEAQMAAITSVTIKINGRCTLKCVGKNPRLAAAKSKSDKDISGLISSVEAAKLTAYAYVNAMEYAVGEEKVQIVSIEFAAQEETDCEFKATILLNIAADAETREIVAAGAGTTRLPEIADAETDEIIVPEQELDALVSVPISWTEDGQAVVTITYVKDGTEIAAFHPRETWHSGAHILNLFYPLLSVAEKTLHTFEVWISIESGSAAIPAQGVLAELTGLGLGAQNRWDGRITVGDDGMAPIRMTGMECPVLSGEAGEAEFCTPEEEGAFDAISRIRLSGMPLYGIGMADVLNVTAAEEE